MHTFFPPLIFIQTSYKLGVPQATGKKLLEEPLEVDKFPGTAQYMEV